MLRTLTLLIVFGTCCAAQDSSLRGPMIQFPAKGWDFGTITRGRQLRHTFELKNTGDQDLVISYAQVTCGCLKLKLDRKILPPGESSVLRIFLDSNRQEGHIKKHIRIQSNAKNQSHVLIPVEGTINPVYRLEYPNLDLGAREQHESIVKEMRIFALPNRWPEISSIEFRGTSIKITTKRFGTPTKAHGIIVSVTARANQKPGRQSIPVRINLKNDLVDAIRFLVLGVVIGDLRIEPKKLTLPPQEKTKTSQTTLTMTSGSQKPFKILKATCHDNRVSIQFTAGKSETSHPLLITFDPKNRGKGLRTRIYIVTDRPDQSVFTVPVNIPVIP